jgi:hypothetical protein
LTEFQEALRKKYRKELERQVAAGLMKPTIRLDGAAGSGKSFIGLHEILRFLKKGIQVLFVARNAALPHFVAAWAFRRLRLSMPEKAAAARLANLSTLFLDSEGYTKEVRKCRINEEIAEVTFDDSYDEKPWNAPTQFGLVIVDEAHHVYGHPKDDKVGESFCARVEECCWGCQERILLSDISQSPGGEYSDIVKERFPRHSGENGVEGVAFNLDIVIRSTERGVLGAMVSCKLFSSALSTSPHQHGVPPLLHHHVTTIASQLSSVFTHPPSPPLRLLCHHVIVTTSPHHHRFTSPPLH